MALPTDHVKKYTWPQSKTDLAFDWVTETVKTLAGNKQVVNREASKAPEEVHAVMLETTIRDYSFMELAVQQFLKDRFPGFECNLRGLPGSEELRFNHPEPLSAHDRESILKLRIKIRRAKNAQDEEEGLFECFNGEQAVYNYPEVPVSNEQTAGEPTMASDIEIEPALLQNSESSQSKDAVNQAGHK